MMSSAFSECDIFQQYTVSSIHYLQISIMLKSTTNFCSYEPEMFVIILTTLLVSMYYYILETVVNQKQK
jgi:hypothetical protein